MQKCKICGADIKYIATNSHDSIVCESERQRFVTENGRLTFGYLVHKCKMKAEVENGKKEK